MSSSNRVVQYSITEYERFAHLSSDASEPVRHRLISMLRDAVIGEALRAGETIVGHPAVSTSPKSAPAFDTDGNRLDNMITIAVAIRAERLPS